MTRTDFPTRRVWYPSIPGYTDEYGVRHPTLWASREYDEDLDEPRRTALSRLLNREWETVGERDGLLDEINEWAVV